MYAGNPEGIEFKKDDLSCYCRDRRRVSFPPTAHKRINPLKYRTCKSARAVGKMPRPAQQSSRKVVEYLMSHFKKASMILPGSTPGFNHALKLSYQTMDPARIVSIGTASHPELTYRYSLSPDVPRYSTGLLTALMDEISTDACFRVGMPSAAGLTLQFQTELVDKNKAIDIFSNRDGRHNEIDIVNKVSKLGKTIAHTRTDFKCPETANVIAFASQVKYMPSGIPWLDFLLKYPKLHDFGIDLVNRFASTPVYEERALAAVIEPHLDMHMEKLKNESESAPCATFTVTTEHTNPFRVMHGGCQAVVLEEVAMEFARTKLAAKEVICEAMQLEFLGAGQLGEIDIFCESLGDMYQSGDQKGLHVRVQMRLRKNNRLCTEGNLRISTT